MSEIRAFHVEQRLELASDADRRDGFYCLCGHDYETTEHAVVKDTLCPSCGELANLALCCARQLDLDCFFPCDAAAISSSNSSVKGTTRPAARSSEQGIHPRVVQKRLDHSTITITLGSYSHVSPTLHDEAAGVVAALILP